MPGRKEGRGPPRGGLLSPTSKFRPPPPPIWSVQSADMDGIWGHPAYEHFDISGFPTYFLPPPLHKKEMVLTFHFIEKFRSAPKILEHDEAASVLQGSKP